MTGRRLDVICLGRSSVDLYGEQVGLPLEDVSSFAKYVGGCATNIAVGAARLGLKSALITRVGDEQMGRFIRQTLQAEGVDVSHVSTDPERLTALVILGIRNQHSFPHIFYRENCADMGLDESHIDDAFIASARALVLTGTHFSKPGVEAASRKAMAAAVKAGTRVVLDIDYRPVAWGLIGHAEGESRFVASAEVSAHLQSIVADCDLIVGTEEEVHIAGGSTDTLEALRTLRSLSKAAIVLKRGPLGCVVFPDAIPDNLDDGIAARGREIEVFNTLGAGDGFLSGFLRGWVPGEDWETSCTWGNASGALVVSRHGCAPAIPSWEELRHFLDHPPTTRQLRKDAALNRLHAATTGRSTPPEIVALAFDHRSQFEDWATAAGAGPDRISAFKDLVAEAAEKAAGGRPGLGLIIDDRFGASSLARLTGTGRWLARPVETPGSRPLRFEAGENIDSTLRSWPAEHVVKCLVLYQPSDPAELREEQERQVSRLFAATRATGHRLLLEVIPPSLGDDAVLEAVDRFYEIGVQPDLWKLPPSVDQAHWVRIAALIGDRDPFCQGFILLGLNAPLDDLRGAFSAVTDIELCKGFAVGRSIFAGLAPDWFAGRLDDKALVDRTAENFGQLIALWDERLRARQAS